MYTTANLKNLSLVALRQELEKAFFQKNKIKLLVKSWKEKASHKIKQKKILIARISTIITKLQSKQNKEINNKKWDLKQEK